MTEKEAIKILQELSLERCETVRLDCGNCDKCEVTIAYDMAIKALEKQIPEKPVEVRNEIVCPTCKTLVGSSPYCRYCGQALDWGDEECGS